VLPSPPILQEAVVLALDLGPLMRPYIDVASRGLSTFVQSKIMHHKTHRVSLIFFGTADTANALAAEDPGNYNHITLRHPLAILTIEYLATLAAPPRGEGASDWLEALCVAVNELAQAEDLQGHRLRVVLVSNFLAPSSSGQDPDFADVKISLIDAIQAKGISLEIISLDMADDDVAHAAAKAANDAQLAGICAETAGSHRSLPSLAQLAGPFPFKEYAPTAQFTGTLRVGPDLGVRVKVTKKVRKETLPRLTRAVDAVSGPETEARRETEWYVEGDEQRMEPVPEGERKKAYRVGQGRAGQDGGSGFYIFVPGKLESAVQHNVLCKTDSRYRMILL
jgi:hypothetical protein